MKFKSRMRPLLKNFKNEYINIKGTIKTNNNGLVKQKIKAGSSTNSGLLNNATFSPYQSRTTVPLSMEEWESKLKFQSTQCSFLPHKERVYGSVANICTFTMYILYVYLDPKVRTYVLRCHRMSIRYYYVPDGVFSPNDNNANKTNIIKFSTQKVYNNTRKP